MPNDPLENRTQVTHETPLRNEFQVTAPSALPTETAELRLDRSIEGAYEAFRRECACGEILENNCAHFLSDALIRAGYTELDGGEGAFARKHDGRAVCKAGRPIRARELREWFGGMATNTHTGEPDDDQYWAVFQLGTHPGRYWGGHVVIHKHSGTTYEYRGTGDYPNWGIQEHYTW